MVEDADGAIVQVGCDIDTAAPPNQAAVVRARIVRLLPRPRIGVAPTDGNTLVNIDTILWAATDADLDLGTATLLGQRVGLRAHLTQVAWRFGDGGTGTTDGPGKAYSDVDPCRTQRCPDYFAHVYDRTGRFVVQATLTWAGQFRVGNGAWQDIPETVPVASPATVVHVKEARAVLVPDP